MIQEYSLKFIQLSNYALALIANLKACMIKFVFSISRLMVKECKIGILNKKMDISLLIIYAQQIKEEMLKVSAKETECLN